VDWIYRDVARVEQSVAAAVAGRTSRYPQVGYPFGFPAHAYAAEVALAKPLADPDGLLAELRAHLTPYPVALRQALMDDLWVADFHLVAARKGVVRRDSVYVAACLSDALLVTAHAVHGLAGRWATNEKGVVAAAGCLPNAPHGFAERCQEAMRCLQPESLGLAVDRAAAIVAEVRARSRGATISGRHQFGEPNVVDGTHITTSFKACRYGVHQRGGVTTSLWGRMSGAWFWVVVGGDGLAGFAGGLMVLVGWDALVVGGGHAPVSCPR